VPRPLFTFDIPQTALVATLDTYDFKKLLSSPRNIIIDVMQPLLFLAIASLSNCILCIADFGLFVSIFGFLVVSSYCVAIPFLKIMMVTSADCCLHATRKSEQDLPWLNLDLYFKNSRICFADFRHPIKNFTKKKSKKSQKKVQKVSVKFFLANFFGYHVPHPICGMPAKILGV
jgi:hypothetical protein